MHKAFQQDVSLLKSFGDQGEQFDANRARIHCCEVVRGIILPQCPDFGDIEEQSE